MTGKSGVAPDSKILGMLHFLRAMTLFREGRPDEAQKLFDQAKAEMPPLPADENKPVVKGFVLNHDTLLWWLLYKEAKATIVEKSTSSP